MSHEQSVRATVSLLQGEIEKLMDQVRAHKVTINHLRQTVLNEPPMYADGDLDTNPLLATRSDEFYGKPLATVVRTILERRLRANLGAASVPEIYGVMKEGGYQFYSKNDANAQRGVHQALSRNTTTFHRLPNGDYGLREWYKALKDRSKRDVNSNGDGNGDEHEESDKPLHEELQEQAEDQKSAEKRSAKAK